MRRTLRSCTSLLALAAVAACAGADDAATTDTAAPTIGAAASDPDQATAGGGLPAGYLGLGDRGADVAEVSYAPQGNRWEVRTGPAHTLYAPQDTVSGSYTATAVFDQMEQPAHPEAFGIILGGQNLDSPENQGYTYFLVRHTGEYMLRVREGADVRTVRDWTASPAVPQTDTTGQGTYRITARVGANDVQFLVNDQEVVSVPKSAVPTDGIAGLRINHNLRLTTEPVSITRG